MKNIIFILLASCYLLSGCNKDKVELLFDAKPETRMKERNEELKSNLISSPNGWKAYLRTSLRGGAYGFYLKFDDKDQVAMVADWNGTTANTFRNSTYRVQYVMNTSLVFDTYNYITIMQDPLSDNNGGTTPNGLQSDIEFEYLRSSGDSIIMKGKKYQNEFVLIKASADDEKVYSNKGYADAINKFDQFFLTKFNNYIEVDSKPVNFYVNKTDKNMTVLYTDAANKTGLKNPGYAVNATGAYFTSQFSFGSYKFVEFRFKADGSAVIIDINGKEYPIKQANTPSYSMDNLFGSNNVFNAILINGTKLPAGVNSNFATVFNGMVARFAATNRTIVSTEFRLATPNIAVVKIVYLSGTTSFIADASFNYTYVNGVLTLSNYKPGYEQTTNWSTRINEIGDFATWWINKSPFKADWVVSSTPSGVLGGLYSNSNQGDLFFGIMSKR